MHSCHKHSLILIWSMWVFLEYLWGGCSLASWEYGSIKDWQVLGENRRDKQRNKVLKYKIHELRKIKRDGRREAYGTILIFWWGYSSLVWCYVKLKLDGWRRSSIWETWGRPTDTGMSALLNLSFCNIILRGRRRLHILHSSWLKTCLRKIFIFFLSQ